MDNATIAARLDEYAGLLELAEASPYSIRAYRRAAELIRGTPAPVAELVRSGRARELRGIGPGIDARLRELVETGGLAELRELRRTVSPELAAFGRLIGIGARRATEIGTALGIRTAPARSSDGSPTRSAAFPPEIPDGGATLRRRLPSRSPPSIRILSGVRSRSCPRSSRSSGPISASPSTGRRSRSSSYRRSRSEP